MLDPTAVLLSGASSEYNWTVENFNSTLGLARSLFGNAMGPTGDSQNMHLECENFVIDERQYSNDHLPSFMEGVIDENYRRDLTSPVTSIEVTLPITSTSSSTSSPRDFPSLAPPRDILPLVQTYKTSLQQILKDNFEDKVDVKTEKAKVVESRSADSGKAEIKAEPSEQFVVNQEQWVGGDECRIQPWYSILEEDDEGHHMWDTFARTILQTLYYFYMPFCVLIGLTGNCMVYILIRSNKMLMKLPTNTYLLCLAAMSSLFLFSLLCFWIGEVSFIYFYDIFKDSLLRTSDFSCKMSNFVAHSCDFSSVWLIVLVGFERLVLLYKKNRGLTVERARAQTAILLMITVLFNGWILFVAEISENGECDIKVNFVGLYNTMTVLESVLCMILPSMIIIVSNFLVCLKLRKHQKRNPGSPTVSFNTSEMIMSTPNSKSYTRISSRFSLDVEKIPKKKKKGLKPAELQLTRSLLIVTTIFILLNLPSYIYRVTILVAGGAPPQGLQDHLEKLTLLAHVCLYTHHAVLFYLYIFYSPQMKRRLKPTALKLLECYCFKPSSDYLERS